MQETEKYLKQEDLIWKKSCDLLSNLSNSDNKDNTDDNTNKENNIYLFGAGNIGVIINNYLKYKNIVPKAFLDNNKLLWGHIIDGLSVISPDDIEVDEDENENIIIIICSENYSKEIEQQLLDKKFDSKQIVICNDMDACVKFIILETRN